MARKKKAVKRKEKPRLTREDVLARGNSRSLKKTEILEKRLAEAEAKVREQGHTIAEYEQELERIKIPVGPNITKSDSAYEFKRKLGQGAQGMVYLAYKVTYSEGKKIDSKRTALKIMRNPGNKQMFQAMMREATFVSKFHQENVIRAEPMEIKDIDELPFGIGASIKKKMGARFRRGIPIMPMEYVPGFKFGNDLGSWYRHLANWRSPFYQGTNKNQMPLQVLWFIISRGGRGLGYIHTEFGKVHKDVKPENIVMDNQGVVKISDFGLCDMNVSEGTIVGTPLYMSPEQMEGKALEPRSDVFSLGIVALEGMLGYNPHSPSAERWLKAKGKYATELSMKEYTSFIDLLRFNAGNFIEHVDANYFKDIKTPFSLELCKEVCEILKAMLEEKPENRPESTELSQRIEGAIYRFGKGPTNNSLKMLGRIYEHDYELGKGFGSSDEYIIYLNEHPEIGKELNFLCIDDSEIPYPTRQVKFGSRDYPLFYDGQGAGTHAAEIDAATRLRRRVEHITDTVSSLELINF